MAITGIPQMIDAICLIVYYRDTHNLIAVVWIKLNLEIFLLVIDTNEVSFKLRHIKASSFEKVSGSTILCSYLKLKRLGISSRNTVLASGDVNSLISFLALYSCLIRADK
ncbi:hypothetical protein PHYBLDRAFT_165053 [Phycomyces blakesleeanus NRRL 1555(-)]|uniref:Uncharacterized protein n=1 Tax=Phycomyces blakesleeanus (strain ATCC 8743b / DSM 1359 / FGSC 10004 / NBRC 33097 / NRRL 1555) TaxID=763407 RepID=A0A162Q244_PHYB8|nr:hypothetical protein PHYBLDRAFT_165053 [Phycomyces blakesleeanus NRRL 1555(-)]OAD76526.1 hypothetical protein PHYBLDRAFT_165053 [Phycomyces blakesleeanus NRRL 1555(-)]|eukprot:XP_018294566.1 hypothetical protein PHYBLDRAFT_165053 [Phycomyces blakesleeanus NRRL 1555(-)]